MFVSRAISISTLIGLRADLHGELQPQAGWLFVVISGICCSLICSSS
jgi:hypothetical protein